MNEAKWYREGLRFSCLRCSACCRGESGYVFLSRADIHTLAGELGMDEYAFSRVYCREVAAGGARLLSLKETSGGDCVLWKGGCAVYKARPAQCRAYPFWPAALVSKEAWEQATADCPGAKTGAVRDAAYIQERAALEEANSRDLARSAGNAALIL